MKYFEIAGGKPLFGEIAVQGSKNAVLPILTSCILGEGSCRIENCPRIRDVDVTIRLLETVGCRVDCDGNCVTVDATHVHSCRLPQREAVSIRSSVLFLGAMIGRCGRVRLPLPGGCAIGKRPVDLHVRALEKLGVRFFGPGRLEAEGSGLRGNLVELPFPSVGATENLLLAAVLAPGRTVIRNAAREPEIDELCAFLNLRGARIRRGRDGSIAVQGVERLAPACYVMKADRIVAGTYLFAAAATGGAVRVTNIGPEGLWNPLRLLRRMGAEAGGCGSCCEVRAHGCLRAVPYLETAPYPGFPTDLQSPLMAVLAGARGESCIRETIFENRFQVAGPLRRMGARIEVSGDCARIQGSPAMRGADVLASDLRSGAALVIAGLAAKGVTRIGNTGYIERGYEDICRDLRRLGAKVLTAGADEESQV